MNKYSISAKLNVFVAIGLMFLIMIITVFVYYSTKQTLLDAQFEKLTAVKSAKKEEISGYLKTLEGLLTSLASNKTTKDSFTALEDSFYKIQKESNLTSIEVKEKLKSDFASNYLNSVNYNIPNVEQKRELEAYVPKDLNGAIAQYENKLGEKNKLTFNPKYNFSYMDAHKIYHSLFH